MSHGYNPGANGVTLNFGVPIKSLDTKGASRNLIALAVNSAGLTVLDIASTANPIRQFGLWAMPTVDAAGVFTSDGAGNVSFGPASAGGTVTSVAAGTGLTASPSPIVGAGTLSITNTAVAAGSYTYASITVNAQGQLTAASSGAAPTGTVTSITAGTGITLTPSPITSTGSVALANTAVTAGSYTYASITVDAQGRLTAASSGSAPGGGTVTHTGGLTSGQLVFGNGTADITVGNLSGDVSTSGSGVTTLATVATAGTNTKITFNAKGLVTSAAAATLASSDYVNQGTTTQVLHGNAAGNPSWGSVVNADIAASTIDLTAKVIGTLPVSNGGTGAATLTNHGVLVGQTTSAVAVTGAGTLGQVLTSNGASADPTFQASTVSGGWGFIQQVSTTSSATKVSFTSIPGTFRDLFISGTWQNASGNAVNIKIEFNADTTASHYSTVLVAARPAGTGAGGGNTNAEFFSTTANGANGGTSHIVNYTSTALAKVFVNQWYTTDASTANSLTINLSGQWTTTNAAITQIDLTIASSSFTNGSVFTLWGIN